MTRVVATALLLACLSSPASGKFLCPPGRFVVHGVGDAAASLPGGVMLELGRRRAALTGVCARTAAGFLRSGDRGTGRVRVRWRRCAPSRHASVHARFDSSAPYCTRLTGTLRVGARRFAIVADREPACGNGLREAGEQCDGVDSAHFGQCCTPDCTLQPGCPLQCDREGRFLCSADEICVHVCGQLGTCQLRSEVRCENGPVCGCDNTTTYPSHCAAFAAGTGVSLVGPCRPPAAVPAAGG